MKKGDKIICIKNFLDTRYSEETSLKMDESFQFHRKMDKNNPADVKRFEEIADECEKLAIASRYEVILFTLGKAYEIRSFFAGSIKIIDDEGNSKHFSILESDELAPYASYKYSDYFITLIEARKRKLDEVAEENFNQFLKKLKKK